MGEGIITAEGLTIGYKQGRRGVKAVQSGLSFALEAGTLTCLLGLNGSGKSTLLRTLSGSQPALEGNFRLNGKPFGAYSAQEISRMIGLVLTDKTYSGGLRVRELVALGRHPYSGFFGLLDEQDYAVTDRSLAQVGVSHKADNYMAELSDGERQKVMIAKALAQECPVILLDEPTAFLDVVSRIEIMNLLRELAMQGRTILLSTHDLEQALQLADTLWLMAKGQGMVFGTTEDLVLGGQVQQLFSRDRILFNTDTGTFRTDAHGFLPVALEAADETLSFWAKNALQRSGFRVAKTGERTLFRLEIHAPTRIELVDEKGQRKTFDSFRELIKRLRNRSSLFSTTENG